MVLNACDDMCLASAHGQRLCMLKTGWRTYARGRVYRYVYGKIGLRSLPMPQRPEIAVQFV